MSDINFLSEFLGITILIYLGCSVGANVNLNKTKGHGAGWIVITIGWAVAVLVPVMMFNRIGGAHFNPAVTLALAVAGDFAWTYVPLYIVCQVAGAILGGFLVWLQYRQHFNITDDKDAKLGVFATSPAIRSPIDNFISEFLATFILVFAICGAVAFSPYSSESSPFAVGGIILAIGMGVGGTTGYAINPARDLGPRIAHFFVPIKNKRDSDWGYAWIPVVAPLLGGATAGVIVRLVFL